MPVYYYELLRSSECWAISKVDGRRLDALDQWCLWRLLGVKWYQFVSNTEVRQTNGHWSTAPFLDHPSTKSLSLSRMLRRSWLQSRQNTEQSPSDHMDEDSPKWPWVTQSHIDWNSQHGSESPDLEVAGCEWRYALTVVQARNDTQGLRDVQRTWVSQFPLNSPSPHILFTPSHHVLLQQEKLQQ